MGVRLGVNVSASSNMRGDSARAIPVVFAARVLSGRGRRNGGGLLMARVNLSDRGD